MTQKDLNRMMQNPVAALDHDTTEALDGKVDKTSEASKLYGTNSEGKQTTIAYGSAMTPGSIPVYLSGNQMNTGDPTAENNAANKRYVDGRVVANPTIPEDTEVTPLDYVKIGDVYYSVAIQPCLIEGTEITLADKTRKRIEELKSGDIILGYDPKTETTCETVVISAYCTGVATQFKCRQFSDGNRVLIYGKHKYYDPKEKHAKEFPDAKGFTVLNENLEEVTCIANRFYSTYGNKTRRWNVITSNNTYFADGILCACGPQDKYSYFLNRFRENTIPENIKEIMLADCASINDIYSVSADKEYLAEVAGKIEARHKAFDAAVAAKNEARKASDDETKGIQKTIEEKRAEYKRLDSEIAAIRKRYVKENPASAFGKCCERDNAALNQFKAWLCVEEKPEEK